MIDTVIRQDGDLLYFADSSTGLFVTDGTVAGTVQLNSDVDARIPGVVPFASPVSSGSEGTFGDDFISGDASANEILGLSGNDSISGAGGNDTLVGDEGEDSLTGDPDLTSCGAVLGTTLSKAALTPMPFWATAATIYSLAATDLTSLRVALEMTAFFPGQPLIASSAAMVTT